MYFTKRKERALTIALLAACLSLWVCVYYLSFCILSIYVCMSLFVYVCFCTCQHTSSVRMYYLSIYTHMCVSLSLCMCVLSVLLCVLSLSVCVTVLRMYTRRATTLSSLCVLLLCVCISSVLHYCAIPCQIFDSLLVVSLTDCLSLFISLLC